jgi:hypothetical protein
MLVVLYLNASIRVLKSAESSFDVVAFTSEKIIQSVFGLILSSDVVITKR